MKKYFIVCILFSLFFISVWLQKTVVFYKAGQLTSHLITSICQDGQGYIGLPRNMV
jgi:hypothetical protein